VGRFEQLVEENLEFSDFVEFVLKSLVECLGERAKSVGLKQVKKKGRAKTLTLYSVLLEEKDPYQEDDPHAVKFWEVICTVLAAIIN